MRFNRSTFFSSLLGLVIFLIHSLVLAENSPPSSAKVEESKYSSSWMSGMLTRGSVGLRPPSLQIVVDVTLTETIERNMGCVSPSEFYQWFPQEAQSGYLRLAKEYFEKDDYEKGIKYARGVILVTPCKETQMGTIVVNQRLAGHLKGIETPKNDTLQFIPVKEALQYIRSPKFSADIVLKAGHNPPVRIPHKDIQALLYKKYGYLPLIPNMGRNLLFRFTESELSSLPQIEKIELVYKSTNDYVGFLSDEMEANFSSKNGDVKILTESELRREELLSKASPIFKSNTTEIFKSDVAEQSSEPIQPIEDSKVEAAQPEQILELNLDFKSLGIGGLNTQMQEVVRAVLSRAVPEEARQKLGIKGHERGILLYGPPGTGKTLIARELSGILNVPESRFHVINGPEVLSSYVGQSENNVRSYFEIAKNDSSHLHVIFFDEIDSIAATRTNGESAGDKVGNRIVNQLLTMMDGANPIHNVLVIAATNRKDIIDPALLRPGRFGIQLNIGLPDKQGRKDIFGIHLKSAIENGALSDDVFLDELAERTNNYAGAEIKGICDMARSLALQEALNLDDPSRIDAKALANIDIDDLAIHMNHFEQALKKILPAFGNNNQSLQKAFPKREYEISFQQKILKKVLYKLQSAPSGRVFSVMITGEKGSGKSAIAGLIADSTKDQFDFVRIIAPSMTNRPLASELEQAWIDAQSVKRALIILDGLEHTAGILNAGVYDQRALIKLNSILNARIENQIAIVATMETGAFNIFKLIDRTANWSSTHKAAGLEQQELDSLLQTLQIPRSEFLETTLNDLPIGKVIELLKVEKATEYSEGQWAERIELLGDGREVEASNW